MPVPDMPPAVDVPRAGLDARSWTRPAARARARILAAIVIASVALRLGSAFFQGDAVEILPAVHDQLSYDQLACRVIDGRGFSFPVNWWPATQAGQPSAHWSFLYTLYLALVYEVFGHHPVAARIIQALAAGLLQPWLTWRIGGRLFGPRTGVIAAALASAYSYFIFYAGALMTETFFILSVLAVLELAIGIRQDAGGRPRLRSILLGLALGCAVLLRQVFLVFVPVLLGWLLWRRYGGAAGGTRQRLINVLIAASILLGMILPWTVRNYAAFGRFVLLNTNAGYAMFWSNHPIHGASFIPIFSRPEAYRDLIPPAWLALNEADLDRKLLQQGLQYVWEEPGRYLLLSLSRVREYFKFWPSAQSGLASNLSRVFSIGLLLPFMLIGVGRSALLLRDRGAPSRGCGNRRMPLVLMYLFMGLYSLIHVLSWTLPRYRLPVDAVLVVFAAAGIVWLLDLLPGPFRRLDGGALSTPPTTTETL